MRKDYGYQWRLRGSQLREDLKMINKIRGGDMTNGDHASHLARSIMEIVPFFGKPSRYEIYALAERSFEATTTKAINDVFASSEAKDNIIEAQRRQIERHETTIRRLQERLEDDTNRTGHPNGPL